MREIELVTELSWVERLIYRFLLIPITKKRLTEREAAVRVDLPQAISPTGAAGATTR